MTPLQLDYIINGAKVFIYRRNDGTTYASLDDFSKFGAEAVKVIRVPLNAKSTTESVLKNAKVKKALALSSQTLGTRPVAAVSTPSGGEQ